MSATVKVRGEAVVSAEPDEVQLALNVTALEDSPERAMGEAARRSEQLEAILDELEIPKARRITSGISVQVEREYERERWRHKGYRASNRVVVRLEEASVLGRLINEATRRADTHLDGPWWRVAVDNPAREEVCRRAAAEARRKAQAYVEALGARLGEIVRVAEPGLDVRRSGEFAVAVQAAGAAPQGPEITVEAGELDITAAVDVTFRLE
jgi:uncharacterized protein YggE